jgi:hypothetical protein
MKDYFLYTKYAICIYFVKRLNKIILLNVFNCILKEENYLCVSCFKINFYKMFTNILVFHVLNNCNKLSHLKYL